MSRDMKFTVDKLPKWVGETSVYRVMLNNMKKLRTGQCLRVKGAKLRRTAIANSLRSYLKHDLAVRDTHSIGTLTDGDDVLFYLWKNEGR